MPNVAQAAGVPGVDVDKVDEGRTGITRQILVARDDLGFPSFCKRCPPAARESVPNVPSPLILSMEGIDGKSLHKDLEPHITGC